MHSLVVNGFFARELDADDVNFIEHVRERGNVACGSLAHPELTVSASDQVWRPPARDEEFDYWQEPYGVEPGVDRRPGAQKRHEDRQAQQAGRELYRALQRARYTKKMEERAATEAELQREQKDWEKRQADLRTESLRRLVRERQADLEWERANPLRARRGRYWEEELPEARKFTRAGRHYVPQWKREEAQEKRTARHRKERAKSLKLLKRRNGAEQAAQAAEEKRMADAIAMQAARVAEREAWAAAKAKRIAEQSAPTPPIPAVTAVFEQPWMIEWQNQNAATLARRQKAQAEALLREQEQRAARQQELEEEAATHQPDPSANIERAQAAAAMRLKRNILAAMHGTAPRIWEVEDLMAATACTNREFVERCCDELTKEGQLRHPFRGENV
jgi:hypothetical protein